MKPCKHSTRICLLIALLTLASCAAQKTHTVAVKACPQSDPLTPEMKQPPPPPAWFSQCLDQITGSLVIEESCLERLGPTLMKLRQLSQSTNSAPE